MRRIADLTVAMLVGMSVHVASAQQSHKEVDLEALESDFTRTRHHRAQLSGLHRPQQPHPDHCHHRLHHLLIAVGIHPLLCFPAEEETGSGQK